MSTTLDRFEKMQKEAFVMPMLGAGLGALGGAAAAGKGKRLKGALLGGAIGGVGGLAGARLGRGLLTRGASGAMKSWERGAQATGAARKWHGGVGYGKLMGGALGGVGLAGGGAAAGAAGGAYAAKKLLRQPQRPQVRRAPMRKFGSDMPPFLSQDRPKSVKRIYSALKRDHPDMPAEMKARIAGRQGKRGKQKQGPPYTAPITAKYKGAAMEVTDALKKRAADLRNDIVNRARHCGEGIEKTAAEEYFRGLSKAETDVEMLGSKFCKLAHGIGQDPWDLACEVAKGFSTYAVLSKTASDPRARELAEFYLDWADDMEKTAGQFRY